MSKQGAFLEMTMLLAERDYPVTSRAMSAMRGYTELTEYKSLILHEIL